jgi:hypothetical protein
LDPETVSWGKGLKEWRLQESEYSERKTVQDGLSVHHAVVSMMDGTYAVVI